MGESINQEPKSTVVVEAINQAQAAALGITPELYVRVVHLGAALHKVFVHQGEEYQRTAQHKYFSHTCQSHGCQAHALTQWTDDDQPLPEDDSIKAVHPMRGGRHDLYAEALRMVGAKRSKYALVDLVSWLLHRFWILERRYNAARRVGNWSHNMKIARTPEEFDAAVDNLEPEHV